MPSICKNRAGGSRNWFGAFVFLFIVAGVFLPRLSFANTLGGQLSEGSNWSGDGYVNGSVTYYITSVPASATRMYFYWGGGNLTPRIWLVNASGSAPVSDGLGNTFNGSTYTVSGCVASTTPQQCYVPVSGLSSKTTLALILENSGNTFNTKGVSYGGTASDFSPYFALTDDGGNTGFVSSVFPSYPTNVTYPANPVTFSGTYNNLDTYDQIVFEISNTDGGVQLMRAIAIPLTNGTGFSYSSEQYLPYQGNYSYRAKLYDTSSGSSTAWTSAVQFALGTTTVATSSLPSSPLFVGDCETFDIACYLKQAIAWTFVPSSDSITQFKSLTLEHSKPFSYAYDVPVLIDELFSGTASSSPVAVSIKGFGNGTSTITFLSEDMLNDIPLSSTIKLILGWIIWLLMADYCYRLIRRMFNAQI